MMVGNQRSSSEGMGNVQRATVQNPEGANGGAARGWGITGEACELTRAMSRERRRRGIFVAKRQKMISPAPSGTASSLGRFRP